MSGQTSEENEKQTAMFEIEPTSHLNIAPTAWRERLKKLAKEVSLSQGQTEELKLALLVMDALALQILDVQGAARQELALVLFRAGSLNWLTQKTIFDVGTSLSTKIATAKGNEKTVSNSQVKPTQLAQVVNPSKGEMRMHREPHLDEKLKKLVSQLRQATGFSPISPTGEWVHLAPVEFDNYVSQLTDGKTSKELCKVLGVTKLVTEAQERYKLPDSLEPAQGLSAALLVVMEYLLQGQPQSTLTNQTTKISAAG